MVVTRRATFHSGVSCSMVNGYVTYAPVVHHPQTQFPRERRTSLSITWKRTSVVFCPFYFACSSNALSAVLTGYRPRSHTWSWNSSVVVVVAHLYCSVRLFRRKNGAILSLFNCCIRDLLNKSCNWCHKPTRD